MKRRRPFLLVLALGLILALGFGGRTFRDTWAQDDPDRRAAPPAAVDDAQAGSPVGFRILDFRGRAGGAERTVTAAVWYPTTGQPERHGYGGVLVGRVAVDAEPLAAPGPRPLLVFSHGYGGSGLSYVFLAEPLAARGWIVVAPDHHDRHSAARIRGGPQEFDRLALLRSAAAITRSGPEDRDAYAYRWDELKITLDGILGEERLGRLIDRARIAVGGHSFGGFTALGLCGTVPERHDRRIRAVLIFSSGASGYLFRPQELESVRMPSMYFFGEAERADTRGSSTMAQLAERIFAGLKPPRYLVEVKGANHFSFNDGLTSGAAARRQSGTAEQHDVIRRYAIAFLERHVGGDAAAAAKVLAASDPRLANYRAEPGDLPEHR